MIDILTWLGAARRGSCAKAGRRQRRVNTLAPALELLEDRRCPSSLPGTPVTPPNHFEPIAILFHNSNPAADPPFVPSDLRTAYGFNNLSTDAKGNPLIGTGQTIAIVDAYDDPNVFTDLDSFDKQFRATTGGPTLFAQFGAASTFLTVFNQNGQKSPLPIQDPSPFPNDWEFEESLDVQWAHSIAPGAKLDLVEANSNSDPDLIQAAVATAADLPGVSVVSMSFGENEDGSSDPGFNSIFVKAGVTFCASTGDSGAPGGYPAYSPNVVAVGGTSLTINRDGSYGGETAWSGSGGGISSVEAEPAYQDGVQSTGSRTIPDVAFLADPDTGVDVVDSFGNSGDPLQQVGGTSLACPMWAATLAVANQGRVSAGLSPLNTTGPTETQTALYGLSSADFNDITSGGNGGFNAGPGYDEVTGLGTPIPNKLIPDLIDGGISATPVANPDTYTTTVGTTLTVDAAQGVLANDTGGGLTAVVQTQPTDGLLTLNPNGSFVYTPTSSTFIGDDSFTYIAHNSDGNSSPATVTIHVVPSTALTGNSIDLTIYPDTKVKNDRVAQFTDPAADGTDQDYLVGITWDNNRRSTVGTAQFLTGNTFDVFASDRVRYGPAGTTGSVTISIENMVTGQSLSLTDTINVVAAPLIAGPAQTIDTELGRKTKGTIATVIDLQPFGVHRRDFDVMTIAWGDGEITTAKLSRGRHGVFKVRGTHRYATANTYDVTITIHDVDGSSVTLTATVVVS